jgi:hypothetical protein
MVAWRAAIKAFAVNLAYKTVLQRNTILHRSTTLETIGK